MDDADGGLRGLRAQPGPGLRRALELTGLVARLPHQLVHGDFWDNNVGFLGGRPVLVADFDFMGERTRIDDLASRCGMPAATLALRRLQRSTSAAKPAKPSPLAGPAGRQP